jgi:two-component system, response regulator
MTDIDNVEILLVEDNPNDAEMTMRSLHKANFINKLFWVRDGVDALDFIRCTGPYAARDRGPGVKLILLDLKMPRLDGIGVLRELKANEETSSIPVVMMTSSNQDRDISDCYRFGVNGYVTKPVKFAAFTEAVANIGMYWLIVNQGPR